MATCGFRPWGSGRLRAELHTHPASVRGRRPGVNTTGGAQGTSGLTVAIRLWEPGDRRSARHVVQELQQEGGATPRLTISTPPGSRSHLPGESLLGGCLGRTVEATPPGRDGEGYLASLRRVEPYIGVGTPGAVSPCFDRQSISKSFLSLREIII
jgi:hypothetical protein